MKNYKITDMKKVSLLLPVAVLLFAACLSKEESLEPEPILNGRTVFLPQEEDTAVTVMLTMDDSWQVRNNNSWFKIRPLSGEAGENEVTFTIIDANLALKEREGTFEIITTAGPVEYYAVQKGMPGVEAAQDAFSIKASDESPRILLYTNTEYTASTDADWLSVSAIEYDKSSDLLMDGVHLSDFQLSNIVLNAEPNPSDTETRSAMLTVVCGNDTTELEIIQLYPMDMTVDFDKTFYRRSLGVRYTATWCQYCPLMAEAFHMAIDVCGDRIIPMTIHASNSDIASGLANELAGFYGVTGLPTGYFNMMATIDNDTDVDVVAETIISLTEEAVSDFPSKTAVSTETSLTGNVVSFSAYVAFKEQKKYNIHVYVMEDGIISGQKKPDGSVDNAYIHDYVERIAVTGLEGEPLKGADAGVVLEYSTTFEIPSGTVENIDNAYLLVFVTYETDGSVVSGSVNGIRYNDLGMVVDNVVKVPLEGKVDFAFE